jgi:predicted nucleic acid-binding protein
MDETIVDTSVVIDYLRGRQAASAYLESHQDRGALSTHTVVVAEILTGARDAREQEAILGARGDSGCMRPTRAFVPPRWNSLRGTAWLAASSGTTA